MHKRIIICCDGTWNTPDQQQDGIPCPTNVVKMARSILPQAQDGKAQVVFYDQGVGTNWGLDRLTGGAFGVGLSKNVQDAYRFIVDNYQEGDELFFFGFSRGAYTARSIVGFIRKCGVLQKEFADMIPEAYQLYRMRDVHPDDNKAVKFRSIYSREVRVKFIGVWDTVGSLGIPVHGFRLLTRGKYEFHDVQLSRIVDNAFHAVSIDEKRKPFKPTLWETKQDPNQRVEQVWFVGVHSNVGGGYPKAGLSDVAFVWMKDRAAQCGLSFDEEYIKKHIHPDRNGKIVNSKKGFFRFTGDYVRSIGRGLQTNESVHQSALDRFRDASSNYHPKNLKEYLSSPSCLITT